MLFASTRAGFVFLLLLGSLPPLARGDDGTKKERTDPYGDPLPADSRKPARAALGILMKRAIADIGRR